MDFFADAAEKIDVIARGQLSRAEVLHALHTLKGNCGVYGQTGLASYCHEVETLLVETSGGLNEAQIRGLRMRWESFAARVRRLLGSEAKGLRIDDQEYEDALRAIVDKAPHDDIFARVLRWKQEKAQSRLECLAEHGRSLAERLGKLPLEVMVDANDLRLPLGSWQPFFASLVHAIRNAVDHGIESAEERTARGKGAALICLRTCVRDESLIVEVEDIGRGIDWSRLASLARERGLAVDSHEDRVALLFEEGVSTCEALSEISGRGVGMGAVKAECERRGGRVEVVSKPGEGTLIRCVFPEVLCERGTKPTAIQSPIQLVGQEPHRRGSSRPSESSPRNSISYM